MCENRKMKRTKIILKREGRGIRKNNRGSEQSTLSACMEISQM
jgi:hypothetical protein